MGKGRGRIAGDRRRNEYFMNDNKTKFVTEKSLKRAPSFDCRWRTNKILAIVIERTKQNVSFT